MQNHGDYSTVGEFYYRKMEMRQKGASKKKININVVNLSVIQIFKNSLVYYHHDGRPRVNLKKSIRK